MRCISTFLFLVHLIGGSVAQNSVFGTWQGRMSTTQGPYTFRLDITPTETSRNRIKGIAIHDRNGSKEVIELEGIIFDDRSIYLVDKADPGSKISVGQTFSRLQFRSSYDSGDLVLDGHWQEYENLQRYRKGRLVLFRQKTKA